MEKHFDKLEKMYSNSNLNKILEGKIEISQGESILNFHFRKNMQSETKNIHNAYNFMSMENVAFYAANSLIEDVLVSTRSFEVSFFKPTNSKKLTAKAKFIEKSMGNYIISTELLDHNGIVISKGKGIFRRSKTLLKNIKNYQ